MTDEKILWEALDKAIKNGWDIMADLGTDDTFHSVGKLLQEVRPPEILIYYTDSDTEVKSLWVAVSDLIFSHNFAKAFFPKTDGHGFSKSDAWKYHLQQMVIEEKPLHYLEQFLR